MRKTCTRFKFQSFFVVCSFGASAHSPLAGAHVCICSLNPFQCIGRFDAMHTKSVCSIIVSICLFLCPFIHPATWCSSGICHHSSAFRVSGSVSGPSSWWVGWLVGGWTKTKHLSIQTYGGMILPKPPSGSMLSRSLAHCGGHHARPFDVDKMQSIG